jgi:hypothetical protein
MGVAAIFFVMVDGADAEVGFQVAEGSLDACEEHVGSPDVGGGKRLVRCS